MNGITVLVKDTPHNAPYTPPPVWGYNKMAVCNPKESIYHQKPTMLVSWSWTLGLQNYEKWISIVYKSPRQWCFPIAANEGDKGNVYEYLPSQQPIIEFQFNTLDSHVLFIKSHDSTWFNPTLSLSLGNFAMSWT